MWDVFASHLAVCVEPGGVVRSGPPAAALLPGSFNPLHHGHAGLAAVAEATPANRSDVSPGTGTPAVSSSTGTNTAQ